MHLPCAMACVVAEAPLLDPASHILADCYYDIVDEHAATVMDENRLRSLWEELEMTDSRPLCEEPDRLTALFSLD